MKTIFICFAAFFLSVCTLLGQNCQAVVPSVASISPAPDTDGYIDLCAGDTIFLSGNVSFPENNTVYNQSAATTNFQWIWENTVAAVGQDTMLVPASPGAYNLSLRAIDIEGCDSLLAVAKVRVSSGVPTVINAVDATNICPSEDIFTAVADVTSPFTYHFSDAAANYENLPIPDGTGVPFVSSIFISDVAESVLTEALVQDLKFCVNIEHSYLRDLEIKVICPDDTEIILHDHPGPTGGAVYLGEPNDFDNAQNPVPGIGYQYCWTADAPNGTWLETVNEQTLTTLPAADYSSFESFDNLIGCPINGEWQLQIADLWGIDNGYLFNWQTSIENVSLTEPDSFTVSATNAEWLSTGANVAQILDDIIGYMPLVSSEYSHVTENNFGCVDTVSFTTTIFSPDYFACADCDEAELMINEDFTLACADESFTLSVPNLVNPETYTYIWTTADGLFLSETNASSVLARGAGTYTLSLTRPDGCTLTDSVVVTNPEPINIDITPTDAAVLCPGESVVLTATVTNSTQEFNYRWLSSENVYVGFEQSLTVAAQDAGLYYSEVLDAAIGCATRDSILLVNTDTFFEEAEISFADCDESDGSISFPNDYGATFNWSNGATGSTLTGLAQGFYNLTLTAENCTAEHTYYVDELQTCKALIAGRVYLTPDCEADENTPGIPQIMIHLLPADIYTYTDIEGFYEFYVEPGTGYSVTYIEEDQFELGCPAPVIEISGVENAEDASLGNDWFADKDDVYNLCVDIFTGTARPGFVQFQQLNVCNYGCLPTSGVLTYQHDSLVTVQSDFLSIFENYDEETQIGSLELPVLAAGECIQYYFLTEISAEAQLDSFLIYTAEVSTEFTDFFPENNSITETDLITGSYDPNDKQNRTGSNPFGSDILIDDNLMRYQIRFQNTGTDTAFTVVIEDVLDEDLDVTTIRPGAASHAYELDFVGNNTLIFRFDNILLPDSTTNLAASQGFVNFTIRANENFAVGTEIENTAAIFFDFNEPVITNTVVNTVVDPISSIFNLSTPDVDLEISPNPVSDILSASFTLSEAAEVDARITDVTGKIVQPLFEKTQFAGGTHNFNFESLHDLPAGIYFLLLHINGEPVGMKWVKQ